MAILMTTTAVDLDEELLNRCIVLTVDEGREQTRAIHERQREEETLDGWRRRRARDGVTRLHRNAQRLLETASRRQPLCRRPALPGQLDEDAARPPEVPVADPLDHAASPAPARGAARRDGRRCRTSR